MKKEVASGTIATVLGTLAIGLLYWFWDFAAPFFSETLPAAVRSLGAWLVDDSDAPRWLLGVLAVPAVYLLWRFTSELMRRWLTPKRPGFHDFTEFCHWGVLWKWQWNGNDIADLAGFCPNCGRKVKFLEDNHIMSYRPTEIHCAHCHRLLCDHPGRVYQILNDVREEVIHTIGTGDWENHVKGQDDTDHKVPG